MTVPTTNITTGPYTGNGLSDEYDYDFKITDESQLTVYETDDSGVRTELVLNTDYTVTGVGVTGGGTVVRTAGNLPTDYTWYIRSNFVPKQETSFASQGGFFPAVHENAFDLLTYLVQQITDKVTRSFRFSDGYSGGASAVLPDPKANTYPRWDASGSALVNDPGTVNFDSNLKEYKRIIRTYLTGVTNSLSADVPSDIVVGDVVFINAYSSVSEISPGSWRLISDTASLPGGATAGVVNISSGGELYVLNNGSNYYRFREVATNQDLVPTVASLRGVTGGVGVDDICLICHTTAGDGGGGDFRWVSGASAGTYVDNNGTIIVPTGGDGSAAWLREISGDFNVDWFGGGVSPDSDASSSAQAAINAISEIGQGRLIFSSGKTYLLDSQINVCDNLVLMGFGAKIIVGRTFAGINRPLIKNFSGVDFSDPGSVIADSNITFLGLEFDGEDVGVDASTVPNANMHGAIICMGGWDANSGVDGLIVQHCSMSNFEGAGVMVWKSSNVNISSNKFKNFFANSDLSIGAAIDAHEIDGFSITDNLIDHDASGLSWHGMVVLDWDAGSANGVISGNVITNMNGGDGISCEGNVADNLDNVTITSNVIYNCAGDGIGVDRCLSVTVSDNRISDIQGMGVLFTGTQDAVICGNSIQGCGSGGILSLSGTVTAVVCGNTVSDVTYLNTNYRGHGICILDGDESVDGQISVCGNTIKDTDGSGVLVYSLGVIVDSNHIYNAGRSSSNTDALRTGIVAGGAGSVSGNQITSAGNTHFAISSGSANLPNLSDNRYGGTFLTNLVFIAYRGAGYIGVSSDLHNVSYNQSLNVLEAAHNGIPTGYFYQGDTIYNTSPAAAGYIGNVVVASGTTWKGFGLIES